ncbi:MAG: hypothetical protein ABIB11_01130 [Candidatus Omnitrophota bacterium]
MKKIQNLIILATIPILVFGCSKPCPYGQKTEIRNISTKETVILTKMPSKGNIYGIKIKISGKIEGESKISLILNDEEYKTNRLNGNFSFIWGGDWYADTAKIIYEPINAKNGNIFIEYEFEDI